MYICKICGYARKDKPEADWDKCPNCDNYDWMKEGERNDKQWTTEPPKQEGQYWCYFPKAHEPLFCLPILLDANGNPWVDSDDRWQLQKVTHWLGPLPAPEPPSEGE